MMPILLDLILLAIVGIFAFIGYKKGFVKIVLGILAFVVALIITIAIYKPVGSIIMQKTNIDETIEQKISDKFLPSNLKSKTENLPGGLLDKGIDTVNAISKGATEKAIMAVSFIIVFLAVRLLLKIIELMFELLTELPVLKQFDKIGGTILGFIRGLLIIIVLFAAISWLSPLMKEEHLNIINKSIICSYLYRHNIIVYLLK